MGKIISVASGKGGVGKTTICCHLGRAMARLKQHTLVIELDNGLRALDLMLSVKNAVFDLDDVLNNRCAPEDAIAVSPSLPHLSFLAASAKYQGLPSMESLRVLCGVLRERYDNILLDIPAGCWAADQIAHASDLILLVVTPDAVCIRDAAMFADYLRDDCHAKAAMRLVINRVRKDRMQAKMVNDLDQIIDETGLQLIGVLPESDEIYFNTSMGNALRKYGMESNIFQAIAKRINGESVPLLFG